MAGGVGAETVLQAVLVLVGMFALGYLLKLMGVLGEEMAPRLARVVTDLLIPAVVFHSLVHRNIDLTELKAPLAMFGAELAVLLLAWIAGRALRLDRARMGVFLLACTFGSSTLLGYGLVREIYGSGGTAMLDAVLVSEAGVGLPIFTIGVAIAIAFGQGGGSWTSTLVSYLRSPIFLAMAAGLAWPLLQLPTGGFVMTVLLRILELMGAGLTAVVAMVVGLMLKPVALRSILPLALATSGLRLIVSPAIAALGAGLLGFAGTERQVLVILAAMPSAALAAVFSARYGCDGALATALVVVTTMMAAVTVVAMFTFLA